MWIMQWIKASLSPGDLRQWSLCVCVWACAGKPFVKCNYFEMLIARLRLPSSFPAGFAGRWAVGVTALLNHWQSSAGTVCLCQCGLWCVSGSVWLSGLQNVHMFVLFSGLRVMAVVIRLRSLFPWSELAVNEHSEVSPSDLAVKSLDYQ